MMFKSYTNVKSTVLFISVYLFFSLIAWYFYGNIALTLIAKSQTFFIGLLIIFICFAIIFLFFIYQYVFKICWDDKSITFKYLCCKKMTYKWDDITSIYYCPKFGVVHLIIATYDGEFYSIPEMSDELHKALEKYSKVKIENIRDPMEVLPALWERKKNRLKMRKKN